MTSNDIEDEDEELVKLMAWQDNQPSISEECEQLEPLLTQDSELKINISSTISPPELELNPRQNILSMHFLYNPILFL